MESSFTIHFRNDRTAQVLKLMSDQDLAVALSAIGLIENRPVLVVIGGASLISDEDLQRLQRLFSEVLAPLAQELGLIVADGGTDARGIINYSLSIIWRSPSQLSSKSDRQGYCFTDRPNCCLSGDNPMLSE